MEEIYNSYKRKYGVGLGDYGLLHLDDIMRAGLSRWLLWPFNENSVFVVKLRIYNKEKTMKEELI
jgi:hypothetical protein